MLDPQLFLAGAARRATSEQLLHAALLGKLGAAIQYKQCGAR